MRSINLCQIARPERSVLPRVRGKVGGRKWVPSFRREMIFDNLVQRVRTGDILRKLPDHYAAIFFPQFRFTVHNVLAHLVEGNAAIEASAGDHIVLPGVGVGRQHGAVCLFDIAVSALRKKKERQE